MGEGCKATDSADGEGDFGFSHGGTRRGVGSHGKGRLIDKAVALAGRQRPSGWTRAAATSRLARLGISLAQHFRETGSVKNQESTPISPVPRSRVALQKTLAKTERNPLKILTSHSSIYEDYRVLSRQTAQRIFCFPGQHCSLVPARHCFWATLCRSTGWGERLCGRI